MCLPEAPQNLQLDHYWTHGARVYVLLAPQDLKRSPFEGKTALASLACGGVTPAVAEACALSEYVRLQSGNSAEPSRPESLHVRKLLLELLRQVPRLRHVASTLSGLCSYRVSELQLCAADRHWNQSSREMPPSALVSKVIHSLATTQRDHGVWKLYWHNLLRISSGAGGCCAAICRHTYLYPEGRAAVAAPRPRKASSVHAVSHPALWSA